MKFWYKSLPKLPNKKTFDISELDNLKLFNLGMFIGNRCLKFPSNNLYKESLRFVVGDNKGLVTFVTTLVL